MNRKEPTVKVKQTEEVEAPALLILVSQISEQMTKMHEIIKEIIKQPSENQDEEVEAF